MTRAQLAALLAREADVDRAVRDADWLSENFDDAFAAIFDVLPPARRARDAAAAERGRV